MKTIKYIGTAFANYAPALFGVLFYRMGIANGAVLLLLQAGLFALNFYIAQSKISFAFLCFNLLLSTAIAHYASTYLYYNFVSADPMTPAIGRLGLFLGVAIVFTVSVVLVILKKQIKNHSIKLLQV